MEPMINEQVELVQVLLYLSDRQEKAIQHLKNKIYSNSITSFFFHTRTIKPSQ